MIFKNNQKLKLYFQKVFVIDKTEAGWWLAAPSGQMDMQPGYIQASCIETNLNESVSESVDCNEQCTVVGEFYTQIMRVK